MNFQRFPPLFGTEGPMVLPERIVTSNVDVAATIFDLADIALPDEYRMDGVSVLTDALRAISSDHFRGSGRCEFRFIDVKNSHSIVSERYQYIFRATETVDSMDGVDALYPDAFDLEQLYDLTVDPNQRANILNDATKMEGYKEEIDAFRSMMREYLDDHCIARDGVECVKPEDPTPTEPAECDLDCCSDGDCRGTLVCSEGRCGRAVSASSATQCAADSDCRGVLVCDDGVCGRHSANNGGGASGGGKGGGGRGSQSAAMEMVGAAPSGLESDGRASEWRMGRVFEISFRFLSAVFWQSVLWIWSLVSFVGPIS